jgi:parvulin-like peptidyl-prolyl isomerase
MTRLRWIWIPLVLLAGCRGTTAPKAGSSASGETVVTYDGGSIALSEIEAAFAEARTPACRTARRARGGGSVDELVACYREVAKGRVLEALITADVPDLQQAIEALDRYPELRRRAYLGPFYRQLAEEVEISDEAIEAQFAAHRDQYGQGGGGSLYSIFRRHQDPGKPQQTYDFLRRLKERYEAGEAFGSLAREYSDSETRLRDGLVGGIGPGDLPPRLEKIAFSLGEGELSDPIPVRGGAVLLMMRGAVQPVAPSLEGARPRIRRELRRRAIEGRARERASTLTPPEEALVLNEDELLAALDEWDTDRLVLDLAGDRMTVGEARRLAGLPPDGGVDVGDGAREALLTAYEERRDNDLLLLDLLATADAEHRLEAEKTLRKTAVAELVDVRLRDEMRGLVEADSESLRRYYQDNRARYQTPPTFKLHTWDLPFGREPPKQLERMERLRESLEAGRIRIAQAAEELGGSVRDLGWKSLDEVPEARGKAREYLLQAGPAGFTVPFQRNRALHMIWVEGRREPRPMSYDEAAPRVVEDYLQRFEEQLYRKVADARLAGSHFVFDEKAVRRALSSSAGGSMSEP